MTKEELEKENAELKERLLKVENAYKRKSEAEWRLNDLYQKSLTDYANAEKCSREYFTRYRDMLDRFIKAKEIICEYVRLANLEKEDTIAIWQLYHKAEQFLRETDIDNAIQQANKGLDFDKIADEMEQDLKDSEVEK